ncbi:Glycine-zipper containing OmpA-like membrane domain-containing protein [Syntrophus gentianae]|uniref:Glycine-zipper containing OmpA-like membrane domain-containing protein n=1 Tax=Syntrophus gentianae TaxID=43775 RepID=A0A1H7VXQ8_9BACT|nr:YMGG-like glycine zipper-containing protein [Syntrophus gentianae]SEM14046.1 Glycine-zipper containing OmpA-like membrane domain-containing protein [Syntrophus gentianae]
MKTLRKSLFLLLLLLSGCATVPTGPSVMVLPPPNKPFEQFQAEDAVCRQWAAQQIGLSPQEAVNQNVAAGAIVGTAVGAGLGAAIGSASGHAGTGAAIGAGSGLLVGTASGANAGRLYGYEAQRRYDIKYMQCMYAKGNQIPGVRTKIIQTVPLPPPPGYTSGPQSYPPGEWVTVPDQWVNGKWVPSHKAWAPLKQ